MKTINLQKGDIVKVIDGVFLNFYGLFLRRIPNDGVRIKVEMFGKKTSINLDSLQIKQVIPKCFKCKKILDIKLEEAKMLSWEYGVPYGACNECLKEYKKFRQEVKKIPMDINGDTGDIKVKENWVKEHNKLMEKYNFERTPSVFTV